MLRRVYLYVRAIPKTVFFNFRYLKFGDAIRLPVIVSHRTFLMKAGGKISIKDPVHFHMIKIGFGEVGIVHQEGSGSVWQVSGTVTFEGKCSLGHGTKINVGENGHLAIGRNCFVSAQTSISCQKEVIIGDNCSLGWDILVMDSDFHAVKDVDGKAVNRPRDIHIGNAVWIGCRCLILKGASIPDETIVAAGSTITKSYSGRRQILGGNPVRLLKEEVTWE